jgi:CHAT domain-containing protein/tetratricopeptide (TPR) repeat protein
LTQAKQETSAQAIPAEVQGWFADAKAAAARGDAAEALRLQKQVLAWLQTNPQAPGVFRARALINLGNFLAELGQSQEALAPTVEAERILRQLQASGPEARRWLAASVNNLGIRLSDLGRHQEALAPSQEAVRIYRELAKSNPADLGALAGSLNNLGNRLSDLGRHQEALAPTKEAVGIYRELAKTNLSDRNELAGALNNLGIRYRDLGRRQEAVAPSEEAVRIRRDLVKTSPAYLAALARSLGNLAVTYRDVDRRQEALTLSAEALEIYRGLAKTNPAYLGSLALTLNNLGTFYSNLGRRQEALAVTDEAVKVYLKLVDTNAFYYSELAMALVNLGAYYDDLGRRGEAFVYAEGAVNVWRILAKSNKAYLGDLGLALTNLTSFYPVLPQRGLAPAEEAMAIYRELASANPFYQGDLARSLSNLAVIYGQLGRHNQALAPIQEALTIYRDLSRNNAIYLGELARTLGNFGIWYSNQGRHQEALAPMEEAVSRLRELANANPAYQQLLASNATNLALLQLELAHSSAALPLFREAVGTEVTYLQGQLPLLPEGRRLTLVAVFGDRWQIPFSQAEQGNSGAALALFTRLNRQGLLQDIQRSQALLARSGPQRPLFQQLSAVTAELASTTLPLQRQAPLLERKEQLEQALYRQLPQIKPRLVEPGQIAALLPAGGALLEFQRYAPYTGSKGGSLRFGSSRYLALLLKPDGTIRAIPLGDAAPIDAAVAAAVAASADPNQQAEAPQKLAAVSRLVLAPLQRQLAGVRELFLSPDGELNRLPFAALPVPAADGNTPADGPTLGDALSLRLLTTGRELLRLQQPAKAGGPAVLIANPDFNASRRPVAAGATPPEAAAERPRHAAGLRGLNPWQPLAGTEEEARALAPVLGVGAVIRGPAATAAVVLAQKAPRILHIATHGFFHPDQPTPPGSTPSASPSAGARGRPAAGGGAPSEGSAPATPSREDPLQRSGLVFAGANQPEADPNDDGYLTAAEATAMDLEGTELVTLSACETGVGGVRSGEGVYGLQRSLAVAGARSSLLSLWKVDDALTAEFMRRYYNRLKTGEGRAEALRHTQAEFRDHKNSTYNDIRVWGAFQLSGDWRSLPGW